MKIHNKHFKWGNSNLKEEINGEAEDEENQEDLEGADQFDSNEFEEEDLESDQEGEDEDDLGVSDSDLQF